MPFGHWWTVAVISWGVLCALTRPWGRILRAPFFPGRHDVIRARGLAYGDGPRRPLDVYRRRDRPVGAPILLHIHGGGFRSGNKGREARPLSSPALVITLSR